MSDTPGSLWYTTAEWRMLKREEYPYQFAEDAVVRYVDVSDARDLESIISYLTGLADTSALVVHGQTLAGTWKTTGAGYGPANPDEPLGAIRVWHALVNAALTASDGPYIVENNCTFQVSLTFYWRQSTLPTVTAGTSGVTYSIASRTRDPVTGLWDYVVEKREQKTTTTGVVTMRDDVFSTVYEQTFYGVRTGDLDENGDAVPLWTVGYADYTIIEDTAVVKNENCTRNITQRKIASKTSVSFEVRREKTAFATTETTVERNSTTAVDAYVDVADGVLYVQASHANDDGTYDNTRVIKTAIASGSVVERERTVFSEAASITLRNQASAVDAFVDVAGGIITRRSSRKNDDGTYDNTEETRAALEASAVVSRERTVFSDDASITLRNQASAVDAYVDVANGVITSRTSKRNDDGTYDNTERTRTALEATAVIERSRTVFGETYSITVRNQASAVNAFVDVANGTITIRSSSQNDNGRYDNTERTVTGIAASAVVERERDKFFETVTITLRNQTDAVDEYADVAGGIVTRRQSKRNDDGTYDNTETLITQLDVASISREYAVDAFSTTTMAGAVQAAIGADPARTAGQILRTSSRLTKNGKWEVTTYIDAANACLYVVVTLPHGNAGTEYIVTFRNATSTNIDDFVAAYGDGCEMIPSYFYNAYERFDGTMRFVPYTNVFSANFSFEGTGFVETECGTAEIKGKLYKRTTTVTFDLKRDWGISAGKAWYTGSLSGGEFHPLGGDAYIAKRVTAITTTFEEITVGSTIEWTRA